MPDDIVREDLWIRVYANTWTSGVGASVASPNEAKWSQFFTAGDLEGAASPPMGSRGSLQWIPCSQNRSHEMQMF